MFIVNRRCFLVIIGLLSIVSQLTVFAITLLTIILGFPVKPVAVPSMLNENVPPEL